jgi:hypothetical protein
MNESTKSKLIGSYTPSALSVVLFCASIAPAVLLFWDEILRALAGDVRGIDIGILAAFFVYCAISSEVNFRLVTVDDIVMSSQGPLRIYRQSLDLSEIGGIRQTKMRAGSTIEVQYRGRWIVFASNRRFKNRVEEATSEAQLPA